MFDNTPKMIYVAFFAFVGIAFLAAIGYTKNEQVIFAFKIAAWFFLILAAVLMGLVVMDAITFRVQVMTDWMIAFAKLPDDEARAAVAFVFPFMRYKMKHGVVREFYKNTNVPAELFRLFLQTSNEKYISPERDWQTHEKPHWAWLEIYEDLCESGYVFPNSASGNISHQWKGESYKHLVAYWKPISRMVNLGMEAA